MNLAAYDDLLVQRYFDRKLSAEKVQRLRSKLNEWENVLLNGGVR